MSHYRYSDPWGFLPSNRDVEQKCFECGQLTKGRHHVVPLSKGGTKQIPLCGSCHALVHDGIELSPLIKFGIEQKRIRQPGWRPGQPRKLTDDVRQRIILLREQGYSFREISSRIGVSVGSCHYVYKESLIKSST